MEAEVAKKDHKDRLKVRDERQRQCLARSRNSELGK